ncbi:phosphoinositide-specific phospholipase C [Polychaeton citri CBS 116435]|uniref:Phosphoinositide phospholipase C n=1 Tax=Polychaeton citri CBS 116435 TaxID=1314669 RepID=A0A9P4QGZ6_9PEZI|nr:phosphoinositide-specific phospholipase C [Polychaeton citri CBS 116435]
MAEHEQAPSVLTSSLAKFNPFSKSKSDGEDLGEKIDINSVGGGGHAGRKTQITCSELTVSHALKVFLVDNNVLSKADAGLDSSKPTPALQQLVAKPHVNVPLNVTDRSHPLPEYFISSSHNTYLLAHQLYGTSSATAYETALGTGSRCVEIDAWNGDENEDEPKVTHGYTLASNIPFRAVCETIRDVVDREGQESTGERGHSAAPIMLSLENHCDTHGQIRLVEIMKEVWGSRLLKEPVTTKGHNEQEGNADHVTLDDLGSKIAVIVEYHSPEEAESEDETPSSESEEEREARKKYKQREKEAPKSGIIPELAELGVYAQSIKPSDRSWMEGELKNGPHHHLINVSETGLSPLIKGSATKISLHNSQHLMRVYPKGTRISSRNLNPVPFWGVGAQICALNWQTFDASMQLNEALFSGSDGYVLKPAALRAGGDGNLSTGRRKKLSLHVAGATNLPVPEGREADEIRPYVTCTLVHPGDLEGEPPKRKTAAYKQHKLGLLHRGENPLPNDPVWDETLEWEFDDNELTFLRILIKSDDKFARNPMFAVTAVRLSYVVQEWTFIRLLDLKGRETHSTLLVKFNLQDL